MTPSVWPLSYEASKWVLQYLPTEHRLNIRLRCPALHTADSVTPLKINTLRVDCRTLTIDNMEYRPTYHDMYDRRHVDDIDQIKVIDHKRNTTAAVNLGVWRRITPMRSFLMNKLLGGRRTPVIVENFKLEREESQNGIVEEVLSLPKDLMMKINSVELIRLEERVLDQLYSSITEGSPTTFRMLNVNDLRDPLFKHSLIQNSQNVDIPIHVFSRTRFDLLSVFGEKEVLFNNGLNREAMKQHYLISSLIRSRQRSNAESGKNIAFKVGPQCKTYVFEYFIRYFLFYGLASRAVVDDVENNRFNIQCISLPMELNKELNVFAIPGTGSDSILKIKVMPQGSARHVE